MRRRARFDPLLAEPTERSDADTGDTDEWDNEGVEDDRLRLIFTCCHPALPSYAQVALTLREVCGITTDEIAHAFLTAAPTLAQRIVRAKGKIRDARIPYQAPSLADLRDLDSVLQVVYLVFNEGYSASSGAAPEAVADVAAHRLREWHGSARLAITCRESPRIMRFDQFWSCW